MIIGVEHQSTFDKNMIFRILNYDATTYINQVESKKEVYPVGNFVFYTGDEINMCKAMDQLFQRMSDEGKLNTLKELLKVKLGTLSRPLEKQLTNTSLEKLNVLTLNIFNVRNEEDVLRIIN